jgi:glycerol-3-phosphate dehydrogenase subunit C
MDETCIFFPELYRLYDKEKQNGQTATEKELHRLAGKCTLCWLCPCPDIRDDIIRAKAALVREKGMPPGVRLLADAEKVCRLAATLPKLTNAILNLAPAQQAIKHFAGIARERRIPELPKENFFSWARRKKLSYKPCSAPRTAYFAGCTAAYLFPEIARAAVEILQHNRIGVYVPLQKCCGMPALVEGEERLTRSSVTSNLRSLLEAARQGFDLVCSCPTCGFFMKVLLKEGAFYSGDYQEAVGAGDDEVLIPDEKSGGKKHMSLQKSTYGKMLKDTTYFSGLDPLARIDLSKKISDMGQYLEKLYRQDRLDTNLGPVTDRMVYFAPCHQREQNIGSPYENLLALIPGLDIHRVGGAMDCCGMGGSMGFKKSFHADSIWLGQQLAVKIKAASPSAIITECLSCRLQFNHLMPEIPVFHPLEIIERAYKSFNNNCRVAAHSPKPRGGKND